MEKTSAFLLLILFSPLLLLLILITFFVFKCNPVFIQWRTVCGMKKFKFYKLRSMYPTAPNIPTGEFINAENFIPRWGRFLRTTSLDEFLNLICILEGNMKFIGPRPIMITETVLIDLRLKNGITCEAGITGLAQINGRDRISLQKKVSCEKFYNRNKHLMSLRIYIVIRTLLMVIKRSGVSH